MTITSQNQVFQVCASDAANGVFETFFTPDVKPTSDNPNVTTVTSNDADVTPSPPWNANIVDGQCQFRLLVPQGVSPGDNATVTISLNGFDGSGNVIDSGFAEYIVQVIDCDCGCSGPDSVVFASGNQNLGTSEFVTDCPGSTFVSLSFNGQTTSASTNGQTIPLGSGTAQFFNGVLVFTNVPNGTYNNVQTVIQDAGGNTFTCSHNVVIGQAACGGCSDSNSINFQTGSQSLGTDEFVNNCPGSEFVSMSHNGQTTSAANNGQTISLGSGTASFFNGVLSLSNVPDGVYDVTTVIQDANGNNFTCTHNISIGDVAEVLDCQGMPTGESVTCGQGGVTWNSVGPVLDAGGNAVTNLIAETNPAGFGTVQSNHVGGGVYSVSYSPPPNCAGTTVTIRLCRPG